jgi:hypothetical protein
MPAAIRAKDGNATKAPEAVAEGGEA